jgi:hypothetical protein
VDQLPFSTLPDFSLATTMAGESSSTAKPNTSQNIRLPGAYGKRKAVANVVPHGHASAETCETIWKNALSAWGFSGTTTTEREDLMWAIAEVLVSGTSAEIDWECVSFEYSGSTYTMSAFADAAAREINYTNPVRVWARDFRRAEIPIRIHTLLGNPENLQIRQTAAANYGTTVDNAEFCFDTAHALLGSGLQLNHAHTALIQALSASVITRSHEDGISRGLAQATSDRSTTIPSTLRTQAPSVAPPVASPAERSGFKPIR